MLVNQIPVNAVEDLGTFEFYEDITQYKYIRYLKYNCKATPKIKKRLLNNNLKLKSNIQIIATRFYPKYSSQVIRKFPDIVYSDILFIYK